MGRDREGGAGPGTGTVAFARRRARDFGLWWVVGGFVVSRVAAFAAGVRFDDHGMADAWQVIDVDLLRHHLVESVFYAHTEPPLFNLFVGIVLNWSPLPARTTFTLAFLALGLVLAVATLDLAWSLGVPRRLAVLVTIVVVCSPSAILYENWMFPTYPGTVLVTVSLAAFARWVRSGALRWLALLTAATAAAILTLAIVHPVWLPVVVGLALLARRPAERRARAGAVLVVLLPLLVVGGLVVKNQVLYGVPGLSSWFGMNLARTTTVQVDDATRQRLLDDGAIDRVAAELPFASLAQYEPVASPCTPAHPQVPVLSRAEKAGGHGANYNDECYLPIYQRYQSAAVALVRADPSSFARSKVAATQITMMPASHFAFLDQNRSRIAQYERIYDKAVLGTYDPHALLVRPRHMDALFDDSYPFASTIAVGLVVVLAAGASAARRWRRTGPSASAATLVVVAVLTVFVFTVGITFELGENNRFRWLVEPLMLLVLARASAGAWARWRGRRRRDPLGLASAPMTAAPVTLAGSEVTIPRLGVGTWAWGDKATWGMGGYDTDLDERTIREAWEASIDAGVTFFDTAEVYGNGESERIIGRLLAEGHGATRPTIATKFLPAPWKLDVTSALMRSLRASTERLGVPRVDLYQIHGPISLRGHGALADALAAGHEAGLLDAIGVSNYSIKETRSMDAALRERGLRLATNQIEFSLLRRSPETSGLLAACAELGVLPLAYSPIGQGRLTGKYSVTNPPPGRRGFSAHPMEKVDRVVAELRRIGGSHDGRTPSQVALNWLIAKGSVPIPGAKNKEQAEQNAGALGWSLTAAEIEALDAAALQGTRSLQNRFWQHG